MARRDRLRDGGIMVEVRRGSDTAELDPRDSDTIREKSRRDMGCWSKARNRSVALNARHQALHPLHKGPWYNATVSLISVVATSLSEHRGSVEDSLSESTMRTENYLEPFPLRRRYIRC
jgi:hypothetical protein